MTLLKRTKDQKKEEWEPKDYEEEKTGRNFVKTKTPRSSKRQYPVKKQIYTHLTAIAFTNS